MKKKFWAASQDSRYRLYKPSAILHWHGWTLKKAFWTH